MCLPWIVWWGLSYYPDPRWYLLKCLAASTWSRSRFRLVRRPFVGILDDHRTVLLVAQEHVRQSLVARTNGLLRSLHMRSPHSYRRQYRWVVAISKWMCLDRLRRLEQCPITPHKSESRCGHCFEYGWPAWYTEPFLTYTNHIQRQRLAVVNTLWLVIAHLHRTYLK